MNPINSTAAKPTGYHLPPLNLHRPSLSKPLPSISLMFPPPPLPRFSLHTIRASLPNSDPNSKNPDKTLKSLKFQASDHKAAPEKSSNSFLSPLKTAIATTVAAAALIYSGYYLTSKPSIATPISPTATATASVQATEEEYVADEEREKSIEEHLVSNPRDVEALKTLMEIKVKSKKVPEAIEIIDKLTEIEPEEVEWPMMKAHLYAYSGEFDLAKHWFDDLLKKDPFRVEAYHGLVTVASQEESTEELGVIERKVEEAIAMCKKENKMTDVRDFKLLLAQIRVLNGIYDDALKLYNELVKEEPRDFRPYLCQGIIYTLLRKNGEAEKCFEKYRRLVPKGHPYASYFDENMMATKLFAQKAESERAMAKN